MAMGRRAPITYKVCTPSLIFRYGINHPNNLSIQNYIIKFFVLVEISFIYKFTNIPMIRLQKKC